MSREVTVRCRVRGCGAKTTEFVGDSDYESYRAAIARGSQGNWDDYWDFMERIDARCYQHEGLTVDGNGRVVVNG